LEGKNEVEKYFKVLLKGIEVYDMKARLNDFSLTREGV